MPYSSDIKHSYIPLTPVAKSQLDALMTHSKPAVSNWISQSEFHAEEGEHCLIQ